MDDYLNGRVTFQILGDSIMNADMVPMPQRWHQMLASAFESQGVRAEMWIGGAVNGSSTEDYLPGGPLAQHIDFCQHNPSVILMDWRINDWWQGTSPQEFYENYADLIARVKTLSPNSDVVLINTPWVYNQEVLATHPIPESQYAAKIRLLSHQYSIPIIELEWYFPGDDPCGFYVPDKVHQSRAGQLVIYTALRSYLLGLVEADMIL